MSSCGICGLIGPEERWGEPNPWTQKQSTPAPANFERLQWTGLDDAWFFAGNVYRCGACEAYFFLTIASSSGLAGNSDYDEYTLKRRGPPSAADLDSEHKRRETAPLLAFQCCQRGDFDSLEQLLGDDRARLAVLETLAALVTGRFPPPVDLERPAAHDTSTAMPVGTDLTPLEPLLRGFLSGPPDLAEAAARTLARHLLRQARHDELQSLLASEGPVQAGAMRAMQDARNDGFTGSGAADAVRLLMLYHVRTRAWQAAIELVRDLRGRRAAAEAIRDIAQGALDVDGPVDLSPLEPALMGASEIPSAAWIGHVPAYEAAAAALKALRNARSRG